MTFDFDYCHANCSHYSITKPFYLKDHPEPETEIHEEPEIIHLDPREPETKTPESEIQTPEPETQIQEKTGPWHSETQRLKEKELSKVALIGMNAFPFVCN